MKIFAFVCMCAISAFAKAEETAYGITQLICNSRESSVHIGNDTDDSLVNTKGTTRQYVDWRSLLIIGPQTNRGGDPLRTGSRVSAHPCGRFTVRFRSGFLNSNPQGELGAIDFAVVEVLMGKKVIVPPTALEICDPALSRYQYFGTCPDVWAKNISIKWDSDVGKGRIIIERSYYDEAYEEKTRVDENDAP